MKKTVQLLMLFIGLAMIMFAGCEQIATNKNDTTKEEPKPADNSSVEGSLLIGDKTFDGLNNMTDDYLSSSGLKSLPLTCPTITASSTSSLPIAVCFDWGTGCSNTVDGITRSGKIYISLSGLMNTANSVATFYFSNFVSDGYKISGVHRITYLGLNTGNNWPRYSIFTEAKIEFPDGKFISYRAEYIRLKSEGAATATPDDDVWRIEGTSSGITKDGVAWKASYPSALVKKNSCKWFSSGTVVVASDNMPPRTINFGDGSCDNKATLKIGDSTVNIEL